MLCDRVTSSADRQLGGLTHPCAGNSGGGWVGGDASSFPGLTRNSEDPLEKGMATHCSILARRIPWTGEFHREAWWVTVHGVAKSWTQLHD